MTDTTITDAIVAPQDDGTGVPDGSEDFNSAAYLSAISRYKGRGSYVGEDESGNPTLQFNDIDTTNEQVDVGPGFAYITESGNQVQSSGGSTYDTTLPVATPYVVILPSEVVDLGLGTDTTNDLWLAIDTTANDGVYIRHGSGLSAPTDPNIKLGTVDTSTGATTRANDLASAPFKSVNTESLVIGGTLYEEDANSPINVSSTTSTTYDIAETYDEIIIIPQRDDVGFDQLQINGKNPSDYETVDNSNTVTNATQFELAHFEDVQYVALFHKKRAGNVRLAVNGTKLVTSGRYSGGDITALNSITFLDSNGSNESFKARVFGRVMNI